MFNFFLPKSTENRQFFTQISIFIFLNLLHRKLKKNRQKNPKRKKTEQKKCYFSDCLSHEYFGSFFTPVRFVLLLLPFDRCNKQTKNQRKRKIQTHALRTNRTETIDRCWYVA